MSSKEWDNNDRADAAMAALNAFADITGNGYETLQDRCGDLIANLMHLATREGFDLSAAIITGSGHYLSETIEENEK